ncbi:hypothetical protein [Vreelandella sp. H-I2]
MEKHYQQAMRFAEECANSYAETGDPALVVTAKRENGVVYIVGELVGNTAHAALDDDGSSVELVRQYFEVYAKAAVTMADLIAVAHRSRSQPKIRIVGGENEATR